MHLLAAQPGGFSDDEGIIDLQQTPADIVVLSAADSSLAALADAASAFSAGFEKSAFEKSAFEKAAFEKPIRAPQIRLANWMQLLKPAAYDLYEDKVLEGSQVVVLSLLGGASYWDYGFERLQAWQKTAANRTLIIVPGDDTSDPELLAASSVPESAALRVWRYLREGGVANAQQLLQFISAEYLAYPLSWSEPKALPNCMIYPATYAEQDTEQSAENAEISAFKIGTLDEWQQRWQQINGADAPVALLLFYRSHLQSGNTEMFEQLLQVLEQQGINPLPVAIASLKDAESIALVNHLNAQTKACLIINSTGFAANRVASPDLCSQPSEFYSPFTAAVPVLQLVLSSSTEEDWQQHPQGLRSRDIAMQVVLPEMDGRIHSRAVSFKTSARFDALTQTPVIRYALQPERAQFVVQLAKAFTTLARKPNRDKRIAMILANYPTKDGRIGNGVGLDTPASALNILRALQVQGYPLGDAADLPVDGDALIQALLGAVTNNPNTLHHLPCWQSLALADYQRCFSQLPNACQAAVLERWGPPEQDIKYRVGRLMLSGIRIGETFVGIQPARGFNVDLAANYHDPDLIPPHNYLAFYFWLREVYRVDALIHVGKHGNLEWLPGKGNALSDHCWPDIALGPLPHFYPFIVNDPGEGAQAKRRTQAVIIDHLMPPMTRADTYGELAELEGLVDEYYQAMGMDDKRQQWLRDEILQQAGKSYLLEELTSSDDKLDSRDGDAVLNQLDAYLCDIKEAQIRHGLHILGQLPDRAKLADTLVALLRLPRGEGAENQGLLHNLIADLDLTQTGDTGEAQLFDPLSATQQNWQGPKPAILQCVSEQLWRSEADTRERLELLSVALIKRYVLQRREQGQIQGKEQGTDLTKPLESEFSLAQLPRTSVQLAYAKNTLQRALEQSAELEIQSLLAGLGGQFVSPGPSGAPTRGRLDTLPTGRNFYSVDNRSIPSPAAWAIGQRSAQALIVRHLQSEGDYPQSLGLSVWGTATMRTGGDDIAQAFALMGVKPVWAQGSNRVVDFELISSALLGRPRVDVTLRVSGFFRDAFPNVMRLFDAAVQAISELEEPGNGNVIAANIRQRQQQLVEQGYSEEKARRHASFRVFGSKPGAYGAGLQGLIDERCWEQKSDLAEAYLNWGGFAYTGQWRSDDELEQDGQAVPEAFQYQLSQLQVVVQNQDNREHDLLDSDDYYQFQGGMSNAVEVFRGAAPQVYHGDHSNPQQPKIRTLKEELNRVVRSRVLNPKWINAMQEHGYKGAFEMSASVDYLFAYDATTNLIADYQYAQVSDALVFDAQNQAFLQQHNPHALEEMAERLLEAIQRGLWQESGEYGEQLQELLLELDEQQEHNSATGAPL